jgi:hypothetical protein
MSLVLNCPLDREVYASLRETRGGSDKLHWDLAVFNYRNGTHVGTKSLDCYVSAPRYKYQMMNQLLDSGSTTDSQPSTTNGTSPFPGDVHVSSICR